MVHNPPPWVLPGFTWYVPHLPGYYQASHGKYPTSLGITRLHMVSTPPPWVLPGFTGNSAVVSAVSKLLEKWKLVAQACPTLCDPVNRSLPGSSVHRIFQASILKWVAIPFSRGSSRPTDRTWVSCLTGRFFTVWAAREAKLLVHPKPNSILGPKSSWLLRALAVKWKAQGWSPHPTPAHSPPTRPQLPGPSHTATP